MQSPELIEIDSSMRAIIQRAYDLGRRDALKKVVDVLGAEDKPQASEPLALMPPDDTGVASGASNGHEVSDVVQNDRPWWARRAR